MIPSNSYVVFATVLFSIAALTNGKPAASLLAIVCERNPDLPMCAGNSDDATFRAFDSSADDSESSRFAKSVSKHDTEEFQIVTYCDRHIQHYEHYCISESSIDKGIKSKVLKFCPSFERFCPELAEKLNRATVKRDIPLVEPPPLPSSSQMGNFEQFDNPIDEERTHQIPERRPETALSPDLIRTCTPDCTAPHCTRECKCANTHTSVHTKCNPPSTSALVGICQAWYKKCPMFKPVSY